MSGLDKPISVSVNGKSLSQILFECISLMGSSEYHLPPDHYFYLLTASTCVIWTQWGTHHVFRQHLHCLQAVKLLGRQFY
ncbi:hypothetical protein GDO78_022277 [Eleutherodactylus coqui]|uniref:Uncharacterized protein n=1 Tax=Eleutherodactylus coqui TaxID=57060 RepID=A0A8J6BDW6_ELECQ|nr:hypothetical protein GDO78_022277 [Eleutherodactylus coqui]